MYRVKLPAARWPFARLIFDPEDGGDMFFRNIGSHKLLGATYQKMATFITTAVNPTIWRWFESNFIAGFVLSLGPSALFSF
jgi:hypothetical protein